MFQLENFSASFYSQVTTTKGRLLVKAKFFSIDLIDDIVSIVYFKNHKKLRIQNEIKKYAICNLQYGKFDSREECLHSLSMYIPRIEEYSKNSLMLT